MAAFRAFATPWVFVFGTDGLVARQGIAADGADLRRLLSAPQRPLKSVAVRGKTSLLGKELSTNGAANALAE